MINCKNCREELETITNYFHGWRHKATGDIWCEPKPQTKAEPMDELGQQVLDYLNSGSTLFADWKGARE